MRKVLWFASVLVIIFAGVLFYYKQSRDFYCLSEDKCVTVWKRPGGTCYVIPGKYYGVTRPSNDYVETANSSSMDIIWGDRPSTIIVVKDEEARILNNSKDKLLIIDHNANRTKYDSIYTYFDGQYRRYKKSTAFISLFIKENYATTNDGRKL